MLKKIILSSAFCTLTFTIPLAATRDYYYEQAAKEIAYQEALEREARIKARAEEKRQQDNAAIIACIQLTGYALYGAAWAGYQVARGALYLGYVTVKFPINFAINNKEAKQDLKDGKAESVIGLCGCLCLVAATLCGIAQSK